jgi:hypothetical protein
MTKVKKLDTIPTQYEGYDSNQQYCDFCKKETPFHTVSVCDSCEATYCMSHIINNVCPLCNKKHTIGA